jgi:dihydroxyacid dehydratase/phosphogluconate dehydratase
MKEGKKQFRSGAWLGRTDTDKDGFIHRSCMRNQGFPGDVFDGRPVIGMCNAWSELTPCNEHLRQLAEAVKRGVRNEHVMQASEGADLDFPVGCRGLTVARESH